jgi:aspartate aminotransferase-like enzyme
MIGNPPEQTIHGIEGKRVFRIGHMGNTASPTYVLPTLSRIEVALRDVGYPVRPGVAVKTAQEVFLSEGL